MKFAGEFIMATGSPQALASQRGQRQDGGSGTAVSLQNTQFTGLGYGFGAPAGVELTVDDPVVPFHGT
jgi:hypothetical protein